MIRILIADDHAMIRAGLRQLFALMHDIETVDEAADGVQVMEKVCNRSCNLVMLDMPMRGVNGADLITRIRLHDAGLPILVFSMRKELQVMRCALQAGATGYVTKGCHPKILMAAIRNTAAGGLFIDPLLVGQTMK